MNLSNDTSLALMQAAQSDTANAIKATKNTASDKDAKRLEEVSKDFEAMFVTEMMKPMFEGVKPDERFGGGKGEEIFQGMMLQEYGKLMAETGQLGISHVIKAELIRMQGEANGARDLSIGEAKIQTQASNKNLDEIIKEQTNANE